MSAAFLPIAALHATHGGIWLVAPDGNVSALSRGEAIARAADTPTIILNAPLVAARLGLSEISGLDLLELFAFVHPARFAVPTPHGLARALNIDPPADDGQALDALLASGATAAFCVELADAVRATAEGRAVFTPGLAGLVLGEYRRIAARNRPGGAGPTLTERETEVLRHVAKGLTAKQIAAKLSVSHRTVENHVQATFRKLQLANRVELTRYAIEHGLDKEP